MKSTPGVLELSRETSVVPRVLVSGVVMVMSPCIEVELLFRVVFAAVKMYPRADCFLSRSCGLVVALK